MTVAQVGILDSSKAKMFLKHSEAAMKFSRDSNMHLQNQNGLETISKMATLVLGRQKSKGRRARCMELCVDK